MPQLTIYLDSKTEKLARRAARSAGLSVSRWVTDVIRQRTKVEWPPEVLQLAGAWKDFPSLSRLRKSTARDSVREGM